MSRLAAHRYFLERLRRQKLDPVVLRTMPPRVAAFMLYEPREPPPWRRQETLAQQAHREMIEDCRAWVGE